ncbi:MAG: divergent PAP2 family protein [Spirochaetes bacterium]|jgi:acid phosphatase family membrane protein YuiD|nr:divergent PAP2 family protein [Spirochaetota bacterium]
MFFELIGNKPLLNATVAFLLSQLIKFLFSLCEGQKKEIHEFFGTGGMPSSHSATVSALSTTIGITTGWGSVSFAISCVFSSIVIYDAATLRRAAGNNAHQINEITSKISEKWDSLPLKLKTSLGHSIPEVAAGIALGTTLAVLSFWL